MTIHPWHGAQQQALSGPRRSQDCIGAPCVLIKTVRARVVLVARQDRPARFRRDSFAPIHRPSSPRGPFARPESRVPSPNPNLGPSQSPSLKAQRLQLGTLCVYIPTYYTPSGNPLTSSPPPTLPVFVRGRLNVSGLPTYHPFLSRASHLGREPAPVRSPHKRTRTRNNSSKLASFAAIRQTGRLVRHTHALAPYRRGSSPVTAPTTGADITAGTPLPLT